MTLTQATDRFERRLVEETSKLRVEMHQGFAGLRQEMAALRVDTLRWSFVLWIGQGAAMAGILATIAR